MDQINNPLYKSIYKYFKDNHITREGFWVFLHNWAHGDLCDLYGDLTDYVDVCDKCNYQIEECWNILINDFPILYNSLIVTNW